MHICPCSRALGICKNKGILTYFGSMTVESVGFSTTLRFVAWIASFLIRRRYVAETAADDAGYSSHWVGNAVDWLRAVSNKNTTHSQTLLLRKRRQRGTDGTRRHHASSCNWTLPATFHKCAGRFAAWGEAPVLRYCQSLACSESKHWPATVSHLMIKALEWVNSRHIIWTAGHGSQCNTCHDILHARPFWPRPFDTCASSWPSHTAEAAPNAISSSVYYENEWVLCAWGSGTNNNRQHNPTNRTSEDVRRDAGGCVQRHCAPGQSKHTTHTISVIGRTSYHSAEWWLHISCIFIY